MPPTRRAVIDVGTNSVKLLVADLAAGGVYPVLEQSEQTRLGQGFYETHQLQPDAIAQTARAVAGFCTLARQWQAASILLIGTSAAREALNQGELCLAVERLSGLPLAIISGNQEAEWVFRGVASDPKLSGRRLLILDVGGGSTEFILGQGQHPLFRESFPLGSLRLLEMLRPHDPPHPTELTGCRSWLRRFFDEHITPGLAAVLTRGGGAPTLLVGTGGTMTILARMEGQMPDFDRERIEGTRLRRDQVLYWVDHLWSLSLAQRRAIIGLPAKRADVILMGVAIFEAVMAHINFPEVYVSTRGLRFGALLHEQGGGA